LALYVFIEKYAACKLPVAAAAVRVVVVVIVIY
jgi:hypothetical protein